MGEHVEIIKVEAENNCTLIQIDARTSKEQIRLFVEVSDIFKAINNQLYRANDKYCVETLGMEKIDPDASNGNELEKVGWEIKKPSNP